MTMVASGPISIGGSATTGGLNQSINLEILRPASATTSLNEAAVRSLAGAPSGAVNISACYGKALPGTIMTPSVARDTWAAATFGGSTYVIAGRNIWSSTNGDNWTVRQLLPYQARGAAWSGSVFVVVGDAGIIYSSPDGVTWTARSSGTTQNLNGIAWSGSIFVAVGNTGVILSSPDGVTWTARSSGYSAGNFTGVAWGSGTFVAVTNTTADSIRRSTDGVTWTNPSVTGFAGNAIAFGASTFVVVGPSRTLRASTTAGASWVTPTQSGTVTTTAFLSVVYAGNRFLAGGFTNSTSLGIWSSTSGTTAWAGQNTNPTTSIWNVITCWLVAPSRVMGFGSTRLNNSAAVISTDGGTTVTNVLTNNTQGLFCIASSGSRFIAGGSSNLSSGTNSLIYSNDGITWASTTYIRQVLCAVFGGGRFVVSGPSGFTATSTDGINFTAVTNSTANQINGLAYNGSLYVCVGQAGTITTSPDGSTWTTRTSPVSANLNGIVWSGSIFVAVGASGTVITSPDGVTWTDRTSGSGTTNNLNSVAWGNGSFVAVGDTVSTSIIISSSDGSTWTTRLSDTTNIRRCVGWTGGAFLVFGANNVGGADTAPNIGSTDLVNWSPINVPSAGNFAVYRGMAVQGTTVAIVGSVGSIVLSSRPSTAAF